MFELVSITIRVSNGIYLNYECDGLFFKKIPHVYCWLFFVSAGTQPMTYVNISYLLNK